ncbi:hypothetical protein EOM82_03915 [bacterium]|nr:hypothetical protein [bacterium]
MKNRQALIIAYLTVAVTLIIIGLLFLLTAAEIAPIFSIMYKINNILGRYVIVIVTMAAGIMLFSNVSATIPNDKLRSGMLIGITTFSTVLTIPLVYVFVAIFFAQNGIIGPVGGGVMSIDKIVEGFNQIFGSGAVVYIIYSIMLVVSIIFIAFPLFTGILNIKGKTLVIGKQDNKLKISIGVLPVLKERISKP